MTARAPTPVVQTPDVPTLLAALGGTADEVAASLRAAGIRGRVREADLCPIARFLGTQGYDEVFVRYGTVLIWNGQERTTPTPEACSAFARAFDAGAYPDLVEVSP